MCYDSRCQKQRILIGVDDLHDFLGVLILSLRVHDHLVGVREHLKHFANARPDFDEQLRHASASIVVHVEQLDGMDLVLERFLPFILLVGFGGSVEPVQKQTDAFFFVDRVDQGHVQIDDENELLSAQELHLRSTIQLWKDRDFGEWRGGRRRRDVWESRLRAIGNSGRNSRFRDAFVGQRLNAEFKFSFFALVDVKQQACRLLEGLWYSFECT